MPSFVWVSVHSNEPHCDEQCEDYYSSEPTPEQALADHLSSDVDQLTIDRCQVVKYPIGFEISWNGKTLIKVYRRLLVHPDRSKRVKAGE